MIPGSANPLLLASAAAAGGYQVSRSLRFNSSDSGFCSRTPAVAGNRKTFTWAGWVKRSDIASAYSFQLFSAATGATDATYTALHFYNNALRLQGYSTEYRTTTAIYRDPGAWMHVVCAVDTTQATGANRIKLYVNGVEVTTFSTSNDPSQNADLYINSTNAHRIGSIQQDNAYSNGYLADVHFIDGQALTPSSFTEVSATTGQLIPKAYSGSFGTNGFWLKFSDNSAATAAALGNDYSGNNNDWTPNNLSVISSYDTVVSNIAAFNTTWTNINNAFDGSTSTYADGTGNNGTVSTITFNRPLTGVTLLEYYWGGTSTYGYNSTNVGTGPSSGSPGYVTAYSGSAITVNNLRAVSQPGDGVVRVYAIRVNGTVLTGYTEGNPTGNDSLVDTPTSISATDTGVGGEIRGNYCTLNPLDSGGGTVSNGNLEHTYNSSNLRVKSTISIPATGKWYAEFVASNAGGGNSLVGIATGASALTGTNWYLGNDAGSWGLQIGSGTMYTYNNGGFSSFGTANNGDVIGVAVDRAAGKIWWSVNNTWIASGDPANGTNARYSNVPATDSLFFALSNANNSSIVFNAGQRAFAYTAPSGFKALCDTNLGDPLVAKPNTLMDVALWSGNGGSQTITLPGAFSPNFVWIKRRSSAFSSLLYDTVRGNGPNTGLISDSTTAEGGASDNATYGYLNAFNSTGFALTAGSSSDYVNTSGQTYVGWAWDAGEGSAVSNGSGSITSQVRANVSAGFSVVTYTVGSNTSQTIGHGLGVAPQLLLVKERNQANNWQVYHASLGNGNFLYLNGTNASAANNLWNNTSPTSTVFSIRSGGSSNFYDGKDQVCYAFTPVIGYSSALAWTGNGSADGPLLNCGFSPRFFIAKRTDSANDWWMWDTARSNTGNPVDEWLSPNRSDAEYPNDGDFDFLSNGIKIRTTSTSVNASGGSYIGFAWASNPFQYARAQ